MATLTDGELFSELQGRQPLACDVTKIPSLSLQRCHDVQTRKLAWNSIWFLRKLQRTRKIFLKIILHRPTCVFKMKIFYKENIQGGREMSAILLTVVGDSWKNHIYIYNMGSKLGTFHRKRCFLFCFFFTPYCLYR